MSSTANIDRQTVAMLTWPIAATTLAILFVARPLVASALVV